MNLAKLDARGAWRGALLGLLVGFLLGELGLRDIISSQRPSLPIVGMCVGAAIGVLGAGLLLEGAGALLGLVYLFIVITPWMSRAAPRWVRSDPVPAHVDAVMVLSSSVGWNGALTFDALARLLTGIEVADSVGARWLVTSRVREVYGRRVVSSDFDQRRTIALTKPHAEWLIVDSVFTTRDEAVRSWALLSSRGVKAIALVTSPMHTRRACATFEQVGFTVTCIPAREHDDNTWHPRLVGDRIAAFRDYLYERLGMIKYRWKGWLPTPKDAAAST